MTIRTSTKTVTFNRPFRLDCLNERLPSGSYNVETDEELVEGVSPPAYRRILTIIHLDGRPGRRTEKRALTIDPKDLEAALRRDAANTAPPPGPKEKPMA